MNKNTVFKKKQQIRTILEYIRSRNGASVDEVKNMLSDYRLSMNTCFFLRKFGAIQQKGSNYFVRSEFVICDQNINDYYDNWHGNSNYARMKLQIDHSGAQTIPLEEFKCIEFLKSLGYKILKPVTDYKEI